jgi:Mrp family chromosome partitioning ATPase
MVATPILGFIENMSYFVVPKEGGGDSGGGGGSGGGSGGGGGGGGRSYAGGGGGGGGGGAEGGSLAEASTASRIYVFGQGGVKRTAEEMGVELLGVGRYKFNAVDP